MKKIIKSGFTLIELLVVITIIWILATWWVAVFTSQISKARDTTRTSDIKAIQWAVEQAYNQNSEYPSGNQTTGGALPTTFSWATKDFLPRIPQDAKHGQTSCQGLVCNYAYMVSDSEVLNGQYELSTAFESSKSLPLALNDWWNADKRLEIFWWWTWALNTTVLTTTAKCAITLNTLAVLDSSCN